MRPTILALAAALVLAGCGGGLSSAPSDPGAAQHHRPTPEPWPEPLPTGAPEEWEPDPYEEPAPYTDPDEDRVSTFALDIDTASYGIAQRSIREGGLPDPGTVRVEEWVNAFDHDYPRPDDEAFAVIADGAPTPFTDRDEVLVRIGIQAADVRERQRDPASLTFVIDTSGSMERDGRLELVKEALTELVLGLRQGDTVAVVTFGDDGRVLLPPTSARDADRILAAIHQLQPGGSTNLEEGLRLGYGLARETLTENGIDRVVLASDGVANVGLVDPAWILRSVREDAEAGIELVSVGVGMGDYNDVLLEQLANDGDGFYAYVNDRAAAVRLFTEDLTGSLQAIALDARVQVEWDPDQVAAYRLLGYENRAIDDEDFTDDRVEAGAIGAGHDVTALYAIRLREDRSSRDPLAVVRLRWTDPHRGDADELAEPIHLDDLARSWDQLDGTFRLDAIVAATAEALRDGRWGRGPDLRDIADVAEREADRLPATDQAHGFLSLLDDLAWMEE